MIVFGVFKYKYQDEKAIRRERKAGEKYREHAHEGPDCDSLFALKPKDHVRFLIDGAIASVAVVC